MYLFNTLSGASVNMNENVYKVGRTSNLKNRLNSYCKGSIPYFRIYVEDEVEFEKQVLELFKGTFKIRPDYGREYFEGNDQDMIYKIFELFFMLSVLSEMKKRNVISSELMMHREQLIYNLQ